MKIHYRKFLEDNRHFLDKIKAGGAKNLPIDTFRQVMIEEFSPAYGSIDRHDFNEVAALIIDIYKRFDEYVVANPTEESGKAAFGDMVHPELKFPEVSKKGRI